MSPAKRSKASKSTRKGKKAAGAKRSARPSAARSAKKAAKTATKGAAKPAKGGPPAQKERRHCIAMDPFGGPCQSAPRLPSKYCTIHSYLDR